MAGLFCGVPAKDSVLPDTVLLLPPEIAMPYEPVSVMVFLAIVSFAPPEMTCRPTTYSKQ
jgi:hypothetical protein